MGSSTKWVGQMIHVGERAIKLKSQSFTEKLAKIFAKINCKAKN